MKIPWKSGKKERGERERLPRFHPATVIRDLGEGEAPFTIADATTGVLVLGATGSGKTSATSRMLAKGYLGSNAEMGGIVLCAKPTERDQWHDWCNETARDRDVIDFNASGDHRFNFTDWEASQPMAGGGLTINIVALLEEIITALEPAKQGGGENAFWEDSLHQLLMMLVLLIQLASYELNLATMRDILRSAPLSLEDVKNPAWQKESACWFFLEKARMLCGSQGDDVQADYAECQAYWLRDFATLSEKTRSIITLMFTKLAAPFTTRPLRKLFCTDTNVRPEDIFDGKIIIIDISTQEFRLAGKISALIWKYCTQIAIMRRANAPKGQYLRPVFIWADEVAENFLSRRDSEYQSVCRQSAGCTVYLGQNINQFRKNLGDNDSFEGLTANLQTKVFHQNTGPSNHWASELLGHRWEQIAGINIGTSGPKSDEAPVDAGSTTHGVNMSEQHRYLVEPSEFTVLKRGGVAYGYEVEAILYKGGQPFRDGLPYKRVLFEQT